MSFTQPKPFVSQSDVDDYINHDKIQCLICGKHYQFLPTHIVRAHKTTADEYRQLFNINAGTALAGLAYRQKQRDKIERLQNEGRLTYEHLDRASAAARGADRNKTDYQRKQQAALVKQVKPYTVNKLPPNSKRADGRDADNARIYQRKYRYTQKSAMSPDDWLALDWSLDNHDLAEMTGKSLYTVEGKRSRYSGVRAKSKTQKMWDNVDWTKSNQQLTDELGYTHDTVATMRSNLRIKMSKQTIITDAVIEPPTPEQIKELRADTGMTQAQVASMLGLTGKSLISDYEQGNKSPNPQTWTLWILLTNQHPDYKLIKK